MQIVKRVDARILAFDIEISPIRGRSYGVYKTNLIAIEQDPFIYNFSYKFLDENGGVKVVAQVDYPDEYNKDPTSDAMVVRELWHVLDEADIVLAHNVAFDTKWANTKFIEQGLTPPSPYRVIDTYQVAKQKTRFVRKSLDYLSRKLTDNKKTRVTHGDLWERCEAGDPVAWKRMNSYVKRDTLLLIRLYKVLLPYFTNHPAVTSRKNACPKCGSSKIVKNGWYHNRGRTLYYQQYLCNNCGGWCRDKNAVKAEDRANIVNAI